MLKKAKGKMLFYLQGHLTPLLQLTVCVVEPEQVCPLCRGDGLVQVLDRVFRPPEQVLEHPE